MKYILLACILSAFVAFIVVAPDVLAGEKKAAEPAGEKKAAEPAVEPEKEAEAQEKEAEEPAKAIEPAGLKREDARPGWVQISDGKVVVGSIYTSSNKRIAVFDRDQKKYERVEWKDIARIEIEVDESLLEQDWRWADGGSDKKIYTNFFYIVQKYRTTVVQKDGKEITGDVAAPLWIVRDKDGQLQRLTLHKRNKADKARKDLVKEPVHMQRLILTDVDGAEKPPEVSADDEKDEESAEEAEQTEGDAKDKPADTPAKDSGKANSGKPKPDANKENRNNR